MTELSSYTGKVIGPAKVMSVIDGETIDISVNYWYTEAPGDPITNVAEIIAGTLLNLGSASTGIIPEGPETGMALLNNVSGNQFGSFSNFINDAFDNVDFSNPQAFIVYMYFDKNMNLDPRSSGIIQYKYQDGRLPGTTSQWQQYPLYAIKYGINIATNANGNVE